MNISGFGHQVWLTAAKKFPSIDGVNGWNDAELDLTSGVNN
jgi:hypothetical protein